ncbi:MAG: CNP1-like family protein [bacterium]
MAGLLLAFTFSTAATAEDPAPQTDFTIDDAYDFVFTDPAELVIDIKVIPDESEFIPVRLDRVPPGLEAYVHVDSMQVDNSNSSIHYWLLLKNNTGGHNLSFEGYRCTAYRYKVHGWAFPGQTPEFRRNSNARWVKVRQSPGSGYRRELGDNYLCRYQTPQSAEQILMSIKGKAISDDESNY